MAVYITKDNFVWNDITEECRFGQIPNTSVFAVYDDETCSMLESDEEVAEAIRIGVRVCTEVGYLPKKTPIDWWHDADKIIKDGFIYVRWSDVRI